MLRTLLLICMLLACRQQMPSSVKSDMTADSLASYMRGTINPIFNYNRTDSALPILDSLKPVVDRFNNYQTTCLWLRMVAIVKAAEGDLDSAQLLVQQAMDKAAKEDTTQRELLAAKIGMSSVLADKLEIDSAIEIAEEAYYLAHKIDRTALPLLTIKLSKLHMDAGNLPAARRYLEDGLRVSVKPAHRAVLTHELARYYEKINKIDSAIIILKQLEKDPRFFSPHFIATVQENLGAMYNANGQYDLALEYQLKGLAAAKKAHTDNSISYFNVGTTYGFLKQHEASINYLDTALLLAAEEENWSFQRRAMYTKATILKDIGKKEASWQALDSAYNLYRVELDSSIFHASKDIETRYQVKAKNDQITSLALINSMTKKTSYQQRIIIYVLACCVILGGFIGYMQIKRRQLQLKLKEATMQQQVLRSQMEPHYIFNTIAVAQAIVRSGDITRAKEFLSRFGRLLRLSLENARQSLVPLEAEIKALESYLALQAMQYPDKFTYSVEVYTEYEQDAVLIPPMLIQPFVENAILHGIHDLEHSGHVSVTVNRDNDMLICQIEDNGRGFDNGSQSQHKRSLSTAITQERLDILGKQTGKKADMEVVDKQMKGLGNGVLVKLKIPLRQPK
ncbi:tetratricopeptide repeat-containing sensor histidine kinase [Chitinophaga tropicalis]|uniref:Tetratricopeptide repeat protein n=1 Tax=Chitinophaga tropicalis TaxID=2683588 RepID=A0A7K1U047_9BACT|nr:histidine kinase [Chitinophaga tropicalis]MVT07744.1 tetratricopeptide repeat protein [Chitinophaga tropicalis]